MKTEYQRNIFVTSFFRSGSTHISRVLANLLDYRIASMAGIVGIGLETQNINPLSSQVILPYGSQVFHQHCPATQRNVEILAEAKITPLVPVRNIADCLVSMHDRIIEEGSRFPGIILTEGFVDWDREQQYDWLVSHCTPWFTQFYVGWSVAPIASRRIKYTDFFNDQVGAVKDLYRWLGLPHVPPDKEIKRVCGKNYNKNVGTSGRGRETLTVEQWARIRSIAEDYGSMWMGRMEEDEIL